MNAPTWDECVQARLASYKQSCPYGNVHLEDAADACEPGDCIECDAAALYRAWLAEERA